MAYKLARVPFSHNWKSFGHHISAVLMRHEYTIITESDLEGDIDLELIRCHEVNARRNALRVRSNILVKINPRNSANVHYRLDRTYSQ